MVLKLNLVAFSLFGNQEKYICGAVANSLLIRSLLPEWRGIFYVGRSISTSITNKLIKNGSKVVRVNDDEDLSATFWRFRAACRPDTLRVIFRDADSRITQREVMMINQWVTSGKSLHVIRDHPFHQSPILAGMWGLQGSKALAFLGDELGSQLHINSKDYGSDQTFLNRRVYPGLISDSLVHDRFFRFEGHARKPPPAIGGEFVGERVDCSGHAEQDQRKMLLAIEQSRLRSFIVRLQANRSWRLNALSSST